MSRLLFLAAVAAVIYWLFVSHRERLSKERGDGDRAEDMVRCAHCGVYLPKSEGLLADGKYYCSEAHRRAFADATQRN
jgi:uncharacterized protein